MTQCLCAWGFNQKRCNLLILCTFQRIKVLQKSRAGAVQIEGFGNRQEPFFENVRFRRIRPPILPFLIIPWRSGCGQQTDQKLMRRAIEIRPRPSKGHKRVLSNTVGNTPGLNMLNGTASAADGQPSGVDQIEDSGFEHDAP